MSRMGWAATVSFASILALGATGLARTNRATARQQGKSVAPEKVFQRKPFTADMVVTIRKENGQTFHGKIYAGEHALRMDMEARPGLKTTNIIRYDKKVIWVLIPNQHMYMEMPLSHEAGMMAMLRDRETHYTIHDLGAERVGAYDCEKYSVHWNRQGRESDGLLWIGKSGEAKGFIVRMEDERNGATSEYRNIQPGEPPASVFEVPAGYQKMQMPVRPGGFSIPHG